MKTVTFSDALLDALGTARRHVLSERTNDVDQVVATVTDKPCFIMPDVTSSDPDLLVITSKKGVHDFYTRERTFMEVITANMLVELSSDWFTFLEAVSTTRQVATGTLHQNDVVVLFPIADDGIIGEVLATRRPWTEAYAGIPAPHIDASQNGDSGSARCANQVTHDKFLDGLRSGDIEAIVSTFAPDARIAVGVHAVEAPAVLSGQGRDTVRRRAGAIVEGLDQRDVVLLNRVVGEWYVFAEWLVRGVPRAGRFSAQNGSETVEIRSASIFPIGEGHLFAAEQGYSVIRTID